MNLRLLFERATHNWPVKVLSVALAILLFLFYRISSLEERFFSVPIEVRVNEEFIPASSYPRNARITIRGDREAVYNVNDDDIQVYADFSQYNREGVYKAPVEYHKQGTALVPEYLEISVEPREFKLQIEEKMEKVLDIIPDIEGYPARGYELGQYFLSPETLRVIGPKSQLENLRSLMTEPIVLKNLQNSFTRKVGIATPENFMLRFPERQEVDFRAIIQETRLIQNYDDVDIILLDLDSRFTIASELPKGTMKFQGSQLVLEETDPRDFSLLIDCSVISSSGVYRLPVEADAPGEVLVLQYTPEEITLMVEEAAGE